MGRHPKMPPWVYVGPHRYEITTKRRHLDPEGDVYGFTDNATLRIGINPRRALSQQQDTLMHEFLHAVFSHTGVTYEIGDTEEEKLIRRITPHLLDLIKHNGHVVEFLQIGGQL